ncbi:NFACT family protein [Helicobacter typhlonius]|uniref:DUF814 domain-containing protein n=11 Tax=Helicobacter typhlonius TaxID=76936 RepID=A0A099UFX5_9HELI|nr:NFACT family protein [Helicobacter typhlonius]TLD78829.1 DUF814 domain-containing protein [Helicobacter typhlonius]CUU40825.1 Fibronectin/fibrinogen-binding protein [Helicobacter typhlonius]
MNIALLKGFCNYMQQMKTIISFKRKGDNLFVLVCENAQGARSRICFDMTRSQSGIFMSDEEVISPKVFCAPFDAKLAQCTTKARIESISVDGENRILRFLLEQKEQYKKQYFWLVCEFTGKHTNVVLCDKNFVVCEALRHIPEHKSSREVRVGKILKPLSQPTNPKPYEPIAIESVETLLYEAYKATYIKAKERKRGQILKSLKSKQNALMRSLETLPKQEGLLESAKTYAEYGGLIFSSLHLLPTHKITADSITLQDVNGNNVCVPLPELRDLQEAGNWYFNQSKKYQKKAAHLHKQVENLEERIQFIAHQIACIERFDEMAEVFAPPPKKQKDLHSKEGESFFIEGFKVSVGRNVKDNQRLLESARADDMWLHIRDVPSAHMIIHCGKKAPSEAILRKAGSVLVGLYAARKGVGDFVVDYTRRKFVKAAPGAQVVYAKYQSLHYRIRDDDKIC